MKNTEKKTGMNLKEQFEQETGLYRTKYDPETGNTNFSDEYVEWLEAKLTALQEVSKIDRRDLARIRNYFGENDTTPFEHWAFDFLDNLMKQQLDDRIGCSHCGKLIDKDALYCPHCLKAS